MLNASWLEGSGSKCELLATRMTPKFILPLTVAKKNQALGFEVVKV
jgi:hypothetical protein